MIATRISLAGLGDGELMLRCRRELESAGYFHLVDVPDGFDHEAFIGRFGTLTPQYGGELIWDLRPEQGMDDVYHSRNTRALVPHTECYEFPGQPPRYLALWCVQPAEDDGGATTLADGYAFLAELSGADLERLRTRTYEFTSSEGLRHQGVEMTARHPILEPRADGRPILRFSYNNTCGDDPFLQDFLARGQRFFTEHHLPIAIERNALLMWDNHRMIHSRTAYTDRRRHLRRALLEERTLAATPAGTPHGLRQLSELTGVVLDSLAAEATSREGPLPAGGPAAMRAAAEELPDTLIPELGTEPAAAVRRLTGLAARWGVDLTSPAAVGRMQCAPTAVAVAAELGVSVLNQGLQAWESGPFAALLEQRLLADLARLAAFPEDAAGSVTSGGSASNLMGLLLARDDALRRAAGVDASRAGLASLGIAPRVLCSAGTHVSVRRAARFTGLGSDAVVEVEGDRYGRMLPRAAAAVLARMGGDELPVALVATAGTTDFGAFDPLPELADVAAEHGVWLHVDAAYGTGALFSGRLAHLVEGIGRADSLTLDLHKFGWTPASSGVFLTRRREALAALAQGAAYLGTPEDEALGFGSLAGASLQTTRRADALKIATALLALGRSGMEELVDRCRELALQAAGAIAEHPRLELAAEPVLTTVVFRCRPSPEGAAPEAWDRLNAAVRRTLMEEGRALVARAVVPDASGRPAEYLKLVVLNPATSSLAPVIDDVVAAAEAIDPVRAGGLVAAR